MKFNKINKFYKKIYSIFNKNVTFFTLFYSVVNINNF